MWTRNIYKPLPDLNSIRRLILEPGKDKDALIGHLEAIDLPQAHGAKSFEAISYVWGKSVRSRSMTINGKRLAITESLQTALRQTRRPDGQRAVWADAICISQEDEQEKGHQVRMMGQIYQRSRCTLICLGCSSQRWPREVAALISNVEKMMDEILDDPGFSGDWDSFPYPEADDPLLSDKRWKSWEKLVNEPWFERGWVVQEAALGPECRVLWAGEDIPWLSILRVEHWLSKRAFYLMQEPLGQGNLSTLHSIRYARQCPEQANTLEPRSARRTPTLGKCDYSGFPGRCSLLTMVRGRKR